MLNNILLLITVLSVFSVKAQDLTCADFKLGQFYIPTTEEGSKFTIRNNDSISELIKMRDPELNKFIVIRDSTTQIEWENGIGNGTPTYETLEWIDDCTYRLTFDSSKSELDEEMKWMNDNNGIVVSKTKIEGNCLYYNATMTTNGGQIISQNAVICK